jgi:ABC-2 type transport system ATP-binding protein
MEEVEAICTRIVIMDKGKNIANGTANELKLMIQNNETIYIDMRALPYEDLENIRQINHVYSAEYAKEQLTVKCNGGKHNLIHIMNYLQEKGITFGRVHSELPTLNDVFLEITGKELRD